MDSNHIFVIIELYWNVSHRNLIIPEIGIFQILLMNRMVEL